MILHKRSFGPLETNAILIGCSQTKRAAVIDPAFGSTSFFLKEIQKDGLVLDKILLTHSHWDHIADVHELKTKTGADVYIHSLDVKNLESPGADKLPLFFSIPGCKADHLIQDGDLLELGHLQIQVIHTPGHSPGGVCFYIPAQKLLLSGDTLFRGTIGNLQLPTACSTSMWPSLKKLATLPSDTRVIPGHGEETSIGRENWLNSAQDIF